MRKATGRAQARDERALEGGIEWIVARELAPLRNELARLRASVEALREAVHPW